MPVFPQTTHRPSVGVSTLKHVLQKNVLEFVLVVRSLAHALCALREHCAHEWLEVLSFGLPHCVHGAILEIQSPAGKVDFLDVDGRCCIGCAPAI